MRGMKIRDTNELIGELAEKHELSKWANNPAEALLNTVLAVRQRWFEKVEPCLENFTQNYPNVQTIYDFKKLIESMNVYEFCDKIFFMKIKKASFWRYNMLKEMITAFIEYQMNNGFTSDYEAMKNWAKNCNLSDLKNDMIGKLPNVGLATVQNLRICLGINTLKPDRHIQNALKEMGLGNNVEVCELISEITGYTPLELDQIFWHWDKN